MSKLLLSFALSLALFGGAASSARADRDWDDYQDDLEDYHEDLEDAREDWREHQEELAENRLHFYRHNYAPRQIVNRGWYAQPTYGYNGGYGGYGYGGYSGVRVQSYYRPPVYQQYNYGVGYGASGPVYVPSGGYYSAPQHCHH